MPCVSAKNIDNGALGLNLRNRLQSSRVLNYAVGGESARDDH
jgi:hypothetical protein